MAWSKVSNDHKKPLMWWYHKILCEYYYKRHQQIMTIGVVYHLSKYHYHLNKLCDYGFNLYGEKIKNNI